MYTVFSLKKARTKKCPELNFASAAVAVDFSNMATSSSASWSRFSQPSNFVNGYVWGEGISVLVASLLIWSITKSSKPNQKTNDRIREQNEHDPGKVAHTRQFPN